MIRWLQSLVRAAPMWALWNRRVGFEYLVPTSSMQSNLTHCWLVDVENGCGVVEEALLAQKTVCLQVDMCRIDQVMRNLITNAVSTHNMHSDNCWPIMMEIRVVLSADEVYSQRRRGFCWDFVQDVQSLRYLQCRSRCKTRKQPYIHNLVRILSLLLLLLLLAG